MGIFCSEVNDTRRHYQLQLLEEEEEEQIRNYQMRSFICLGCT